MKLVDLENSVRQHSGTFLCEQVQDPSNTKSVGFVHVVTEPAGTDEVPDVGRLRDVYDTFGSILLYCDGHSGEAARYLAPPSEWEELYDEFYLWAEDALEEEIMLDPEDPYEPPVVDEVPVPTWVKTCVAVGEVPRSGNFILVATEGTEAGHVFEFDHAGQQFTYEARDLVEYIHKLITPTSVTLTDLATYMRFMDGDDDKVQWWVRAMTDNHGRVVHTEVAPVVQPVTEE